MAYPPSSYGDRPPLQSYRRSFTLPSRSLSIHEKAGLDRADANTDLLFSHKSARIILFSPPTDSIPTKSKEILPDADYPVDAVETLPWRSRTEELAATGPIVIEKVRGSTYFLKSADQKVIHTIMRNSQCWCVDGESKFVLRIGKLRYYRIELPSESEEDKKKVQELKDALPKVLRFERTPCPFKRAFHVDLPDDAITPRRKGTWKRKQQPLPATPNTDPLPLRRTKTNRTWSLQGDNPSTPLQTYGRRGSDYGFSASRGSSPRPPYSGDGYRSTTPSSLASSEDAVDRRYDETSSDDGSPHEETRSQQEHEEDSTNDSGPREPSPTSEIVVVLQQPNENENQAARVEESASDLQNANVADSAFGMGSLVKTQAPYSNTELELPEAPTGQTVDLDAASDSSENLASEVPAQAETPDISTYEALQADEKGAVQGEPNSEIKDSDVSCPSTGPEMLPEISSPKPAEEVTGPSAEPEIDGSVDSVDYQPPSDALAAAVIPGSSRIVPEHTNDEINLLAQDDDDALSRVSSVDSFHTTNSLTEEIFSHRIDAFDLEKTPHAEKFDPFSLKARQHRREISELTVTASTVDESVDSNTDLRTSTSDSIEQPTTPALARSTISDSSWPEVQTPSSPAKDDGLRRRVRRQRSLSPLLPSTTLWSPGSPTQADNFTAAFLQKACNVALVKPMEAVVLLVHILARIAGGATVNDLINGDLFRRPEKHRRSSSFPDQVSSPSDDSDEDDFGVPIRGRNRSNESKSAISAKEDDTDSMFDLD